MLWAILMNKNEPVNRPCEHYVTGRKLCASHQSDIL